MMTADNTRRKSPLQETEAKRAKPKQKAAQRYRVCGTPSRLGCITCKIRRVKCGEEKPFCIRCTSTGRKCDGYGPRNLQSSPVPPSPTALSITAYPTQDPMEQRYLHFFNTFTAPSLSADFSPEFWERRVLQASAAEPSIRHAVIALGAIHEDYCMRQQSNNQEYDSSTQAFAFRQYTKAISDLQQLMPIQNQPLDTTLIACILFISFDSLIGNHASAIIHLKAGLKLLEDIQAQSALGISSAIGWVNEFAPQLLSLGVQAVAFIDPADLIGRNTLLLALKKTGGCIQPLFFTSVDQARYALDTISVAILEAKNNILANKQYLYPTGQQFIENNSQIIAWTQKLDNFICDFSPVDPSLDKDQRAVRVLKIRSLAFSLFASTCSEIDKKYQDIIFHAEHLIQPLRDNINDLTPHFSTNISLLGSLFLAAYNSPSLPIRQKAIALMSLYPRREGFWDSKDTVRVVKAHAQQIVQTDSQMEAEAEARIWCDLIATTKNRVLWPFGDNLLAPPSIENGTGGQDARAIQSDFRDTFENRI